MRYLYCALGLIFAVAGCSSVSHDTAYRGEQGTAFILVAEDGQKDTGDHHFVYNLRLLNTEKSAFAKGYKWVAFNGLNDFPSDELAKPRTLDTPLRFAGMPIPAGDYALTRHFTQGYTEHGNTSFVTCFSLGAAVFHLQEGAINVIHTSKMQDRPMLDSDTTKAHVSAVLAGYPKLSAPVVYAASIGFVTFKTSTNILGNPTCEPDGPIAFTPKPSP